MHALDATPHSLDYLAMVPHDPLRMRVMGARAEAREAATADDIAAMRELLGAALDAGAAGFSTGRSDNHRTAEGHDTPASIANAAELCGLAQAFEGRQHGVVQVVSDFDLMQGPGGFDAEFELVEQLARASGRPLSMTWLQRDPGGDQYLALQARVEAAVAQGLPLYLQTAARGIGVIITDHNVRETLRIVDRAYLLEKGKVHFEGTGEELIKDDQARKFYLGEDFNM
jgi:N-acyl-D-aspartate/D-glutamate deacylase